jgi:hypothetical protein
MKQTILQLSAKIAELENELSRRQKYFLDMAANEIKTSFYEQNAISDLLVMQKIKTQISELLYAVQILQSKTQGDEK